MWMLSLLMCMDMPLGPREGGFRCNEQGIMFRLDYAWRFQILGMVGWWCSGACYRRISAPGRVQLQFPDREGTNAVVATTEVDANT